MPRPHRLSSRRGAADPLVRETEHFGTRPPPEDEGGANNDAYINMVNNKGNYSNGNFSNIGPMPSEEGRKEEEGRRAGVFVVLLP